MICKSFKYLKHASFIGYDGLITIFQFLNDSRLNFTNEKKNLSIKLCQEKRSLNIFFFSYSAGK